MIDFNRRLLIACVIMLLMLAVSAAGILWGFYTFAELIQASMGEPPVVTDVSAYDKIRRKHLEKHPAAWLAHFPKTVDPDDPSIRFSAFPGHAKRPAHFQLRRKLPPQDVSALLARTGVTAVRAFEGGGRAAHARGSEGIPTTDFHTAEGDPERPPPFPESFTVFVLHAQPLGDAADRWEKGRTAGVAVDPESSDVVYWATAW